MNFGGLKKSMFLQKIDNWVLERFDNLVVFFNNCGLPRWAQLAVLALMWTGCMFALAAMQEWEQLQVLVLGFVIFVVVSFNHNSEQRGPASRNKFILANRQSHFWFFFRMFFVFAGLGSIASTIAVFSGGLSSPQVLVFNLLERTLFIVWIYYDETLTPTDPPGKFFKLLKAQTST